MHLPIHAGVVALFMTAALAQIPCFDTNLGPNLNLTDESFSAPIALGFPFTYAGTTYTDVQVCSNGWVVFGAGAPGVANYSPTTYELCNDPFVRVAVLWVDFNPGAAGSGGVHANAVAATANHPAYFSVTYDGVYRYNTTTPHTVQMRLVADNSFEFTFGADVANNAGHWVHGASPGNGVTTNSVDFENLPIMTAGNPTLHQNGSNGVPFADTVFKWTPDGTGGYVVTLAPSCASHQVFGSGCVARYGSFYEYFPNSTGMDLSNTAISGLFSSSNSSYLMIPGTTAFLAPSASATNIGLGDDDELSVTLSAPLPYPGGTASTVFVGSNGYISIGSNGAGYQPNPGALLSRISASWNVWHDFICDPSNNVMFEEVSGVAYFTWNSVLSYVGLAAGVTPSTFQFQFELNTGHFHIVFQNMDNVSVSGYQGGDGYLVGFSPSGASADPGGVDLSTALPSTITAAIPEIVPLLLAPLARPTLGSTVGLEVSNIPAGSPFGAVLLGLVGNDPGLPLASIGMPDCFQYTNILASVVFFGPVGPVTVPFNVPVSSAYVGIAVYSQGASWSPPATPLGAIASNGVCLSIGN